MENEKLKLWLDFGKFFLGTFLIGFVSMVVKWGFQDREIAIKESEQVGKYVEIALLEDVGVRKRFAEYFKTVLVSGDYRDRWDDYYNLVNTEYQLKSNRRDSLNKAYITMLERFEHSTDTSYIEESDTIYPQVTESDLQMIKMQVRQIDEELNVKKNPNLNPRSYREQKRDTTT